MLEKYKDVLNISELCEILRIGKTTAYKMLRDKEIANRLCGNKYIIPKAAVIDYLTDCQTFQEN